MFHVSLRNRKKNLKSVLLFKNITLSTKWLIKKTQKIHRPCSVITTKSFKNEECRHSHYNYTRKKFANNGCKQGLFVAVCSMFLGVQSLKDIYAV